jgi:hypothetical protein
MFKKRVTRWDLHGPPTTATGAQVHGCVHAARQQPERRTHATIFLTRAVRLKTGRFTGLTKNWPVHLIFTGPIA